MIREDKVFEAKVSELNNAIGFVEQFLETVDCPMKTAMNITIAFEELFVNVASYAYPDSEGVAKVSLIGDNNKLMVIISDSGIPYNPLEKMDPDITLNANDRPIGGLGIYMVKKMMDEMSYEYVNGENITKFVKSF